MKLIDLYNAIIEIGIENDPRSKEVINKSLESKKKAYNKMSDKKKAFYDKEKLSNPYSDSRIYNGTGKEEVKSLMVGVDVETPELVLVDRLREKGQKIDAVLTHHPEGKALLSLNEVMYMQADVMHKFGVPINIADGVLEGRIKDVSRGVLPVNYARSVRAAELLDIPYFGAHTPADNCVSTYLQKIFDEKKPDTIDKVINMLMEIKEYELSFKDNNGPRAVVGSISDRAGKVYVDMTGGTEGSPEMLDKLAAQGVGTIVAMHMSKKHTERAEKNHLRVVIAGHMASDAVGLNILLDEVEKRLGKLDIIDCSGFTRIKRIK